MIKFFRRIRQQLVSQNKFSKYMIYAIGEIVLVVVGILIALSINNWNEGQKIKLQEKALLNNIIEDLKSDSLEFQNTLSHLQIQLKVVDELITQPQNLNLMKERKNLGYLRWSTTFSPITKENNLIVISQLFNISLRSSIQRYFRQQENTEEIVLEYSSVILDNVRPFLSKNGINNTEALNEPNIELRTNKILLISKLAEQYGSTEFKQILFELQLKTSESIQNIKELSMANEELMLKIQEGINSY